MRRRALVVDDDRMMVRTLADVLRIHGWDVTTAHDGAVAVERATASPYDVILMDVRMSGLDGLSAFRVIRAARPKVPVVLMSAYMSQETVTAAERAGVVRVLSKPVDIPPLLSLLAAGVRRSRRVLLVDTDADFAHSLAEVLQLQGFDTVLAASLDEAVRAMDARRPEAVLLHLHLSGTSAIEAVAAVRLHGAGAALIVYSGRPGADEEARQLPADAIHACLQKPFAVEQVTEVLDAIGAGN